MGRGGGGTGEGVIALIMWSELFFKLELCTVTPPNRQIQGVAMVEFINKIDEVIYEGGVIEKTWSEVGDVRYCF